MFLLRGAGWTAVGLLIGFIASYFFRLPLRIDVDAFALTETLLGVVITGLSIVGAFLIVLQWSNLDRRMHEFDVKVKEEEDFFDKQAERMQSIAADTDAYIQSTVDEYKEKVNAIYKHFEEEVQIANEVNKKIEEYKSFYEEKTNKIEEKLREIAERQKEFDTIIDANKKPVE